jgi:hypothetical protein
MTAVAADAISYEDLYARWERGNWRATEIDFTEDRRQWQEVFTPFEREAALWNYSLFFWGEDAVADTLAPFVDAAPREEQCYFLATQQVDEARHAVFFKRFMHEVAGIGTGDLSSGLEAIRPRLTWGFRKVFGELDVIAARLKRKPTRANLAAGVAMYHFVVEASLAQPGQHFIESYLTAQNVLPGFRAGIANVAADEQRHIGFGVKLLADLVREDERCLEAVGDVLRRVIPWTTAVLWPPGGDRRYVEVFGTTLEEVALSGVQSLVSKLRAAGIDWETLPGGPPLLLGLTPEEQARHGLDLVETGILGEPNGGVRHDERTARLLFETIRRSIPASRAPGRPITLQWDFTDAPPWHLRVDNGSTATGPGPAPGKADVRVRVAWNDWVDVVAGRVDPRRLLLTGRLRPKGSLRMLAALPRLLPSRGR